MWESFQGKNYVSRSYESLGGPNVCSFLKEFLSLLTNSSMLAGYFVDNLSTIIFLLCVPGLHMHGHFVVVTETSSQCNCSQVKIN